MSRNKMRQSEELKHQSESDELVDYQPKRQKFSRGAYLVCSKKLFSLKQGKLEFLP